MSQIFTTFCVLVALVDAASLRSGHQGSLALPANITSVNISNLGAETHVVSTLFSDRSTHTIGTDKQTALPPSMFVAVFTTRSTPTEKRNAIRALWQEVDGGTGNICARFVVCDNVDNFQASLLAEHTVNGDILFLSCQEGYAQGLLTKKVIASMRAFATAPNVHDACLNRPLFMKVDDDTFVAGHRFRQGLSAAAGMYGELVYAGVDLPSQPPTRNPQSHWYEPYNTWPHENYPPAMYGGPGYILGRSMINQIIDEGIADSNVLWNEDRAVGVWVNALQQRGVFVNWIRIPGSNGFAWDQPIKSGPWGQYPYVMHHHLSKECIACLIQVDRANNAYAETAGCFALNPLA